ncbi:dibenzothiophene desulfurase [Mesobaculum littorinae]|uniref:Dibenzothiophene desulfurase n=1 Tax=Mesobaculum littorinae TaxID=2486419 RepID=A0A438AJ75_9RHOB|nr:DmsC/YnfH family molybdoenzyme membrane anchor subunit [Mesobaculum littorinae]RVV98706.1 dibenzothiophene desulfurase [Mesobaculum littorinae]
MHPAASLLIFTTASGLGFGLLALLGVGLPRFDGLSAWAFYSLGFALACGGLLASTAHLGHPERALKAFREWRSSWLSREAWASAATLAVMGIYAVLHLLWGLRVAPLGWLGTALCLGTVVATSRIYAQLRTVPRWNHWSTTALFLGYALSGGALLAGQVTAALLLLILTGGAQIAAWMDGDRRFAARRHSIPSATGLGAPGGIRQFEPPHTGSNYLTREMVFVVARKHVAKLRVIGLALAVLLPVGLLVLPFSHILAALAVVSHVAGVVVIRWLFFAEAEHVVGLYYGRDPVRR